MTGEPRHYRRWVKASGLVAFEVAEGQTDLQVLAERDLSAEALAAVREARGAIEDHIRSQPEFLSAEEPIEVPGGCPPIVLAMARAARQAGVGPMAAVAGAVAEFVGGRLLEHSAEVIVENGGDIFMASSSDRTVAIYAGDSPFSGALGVRIASGRTPVGVCTSSGTVGHSKSYGVADAAVVIAPDAALADAVATATGNRVGSAADLEAAVEWAASVEGVLGSLVVLGEKLAVAGEVELARL